MTFVCIHMKPVQVHTLYVWSNCNATLFPPEIPFERDVKEFCLAEMKVHHIPVYLEDDMMEKLSRVSVM